jgi:hypothetical protein
MMGLSTDVHTDSAFLVLRITLFRINEYSLQTGLWKGCRGYLGNYRVN